MIEFISVPASLVDFDSIIAHNESVACRNATVIINQDGYATCWYDNNKPVVFMVEDREES